MLIFIWTMIGILITLSGAFLVTLPYRRKLKIKNSELVDLKLKLGRLEAQRHWTIQFLVGQVEVDSVDLTDCLINDIAPFDYLIGNEVNSSSLASKKDDLGQDKLRSRKHPLTGSWMRSLNNRKDARDGLKYVRRPKC